MSFYSNGTVVWVDLGHSYGRWPAEIVDLRQVQSTSKASKDVSKTFVPKRDPESSLKEENGDEATSSSSKTPLDD